MLGPSISHPVKTKKENHNNGKVVVDNSISEVLKSSAEAMRSSVSAFACLAVPDGQVLVHPLNGHVPSIEL